MARECGGCTICCKTMAVVELGKRHGEWCKHCDIGHQCRIYDNRPTECREYNCAWLLDETIADELRPDECRVVLQRSGTILVAHCDPHRPMAWLDNSAVYRLLKDAAKAGSEVSARAGHRCWVIGTRGNIEIPPAWLTGGRVGEGRIRMPREHAMRLGVGRWAA